MSARWPNCSSTSAMSAIGSARFTDFRANGKVVTGEGG